MLFLKRTKERQERWLSRKEYTKYSYRGPGFSFQYPASTCRPYVIPVPGDPVFFLTSIGIRCAHAIYTYMQLIHSCTKVKINTSKDMLLNEFHILSIPEVNLCVNMLIVLLDSSRHNNPYGNPVLLTQ